MRVLLQNSNIPATVFDPLGSARRKLMFRNGGKHAGLVRSRNVEFNNAMPRPLIGNCLCLEFADERMVT
jgi:hypothetical protein